MEGPHIEKKETIDPTEALKSEFLRVRGLIEEKEKKLNELSDDSSDTITKKAGLNIQLDILRVKLTRATQDLIDAGIDVMELDSEENDNLRVGDYSKIVFTTESGNTYTIEKRDDGQYAIINSKTNTEEVVDARHIENVVLKRGEKLEMGSGATTPIVAITTY